MLRRLLIVLGVVVLAATAYPTPARAAVQFEWDYAVRGTPPDGLECATYLGAKACYQEYGDTLWVKDLASDGFSAIARWWDYIDEGGGRYKLYRQGACRNKLGSGAWGYCNKNFWETNMLVSTPCLYDGDTGRFYPADCD